MNDQLKAISSGSRTLFVQERVPLFQNKVYTTEARARAAESGPVELVQSLQTGFLYNARFDPSRMDYDQDYHNEQTNSGFFLRHQLDVLDLLKVHHLRERKVVEIGCGKGDFMRLMQQEGVDCTGFDPSYEGDDPAIVKEYFTEEQQLEAGLVILRHTLEHIGDPHLFLHQIAAANNYQGHVYVEVPTFEWILKKEAFWDIFYEHCNYFTEGTLACLFDAAETGPLFGGQYIYVYAPFNSLRKEIPQQQFQPLQPLSFPHSLGHWQQQLQGMKEVFIWGAGAKGSTFLNLLDPDRKAVKGVIDINPEKQGKFVGVTGHPIFSPDVLLKESCSHVIVMNQNYLAEIKERIAQYPVKPEVVNL